MKKYLLMIAFASAFFVSCKKEHADESKPAQKTYKVRFNVTGFSKSTGPFKTDAVGTHASAADSLRSNISVLYYLVYRNRIKIRTLVQRSTDANFGTITDSLSADKDQYGSLPNYQVIVVGGKDNLTGYYTGNDPNADYEDFGYTNNGQADYFDDTFYKSISFQVPDSNYRVVAQLKVNIQDAIPANAKQIQVTFSDYQDMRTSTGQVDPNALALRRTIQKEVKPGATGTMLSAILLNTKDTFSVEIKCLDANNNVIAVKTVGGVSCKANETTLLTGNLFGTGGTGFNVTYDPTWGVPTQTGF
jgi:hypothetical protein